VREGKRCARRPTGRRRHSAPSLLAIYVREGAYEHRLRQRLMFSGPASRTEGQAQGAMSRSGALTFPRSLCGMTGQGRGVGVGECGEGYGM